LKEIENAQANIRVREEDARFAAESSSKQRDHGRHFQRLGGLDQGHQSKGKEASRGPRVRTE